MPTTQFGDSPRMRNQQATDGDEPPAVQITMPVTLKDFAFAVGLKPFKVIADLMEAGLFFSMNMDLSEPDMRIIEKKNRLQLQIIPRSPD